MSTWVDICAKCESVMHLHCPLCGKLEAMMLRGNVLSLSASEVRNIGRNMKGHAVSNRIAEKWGRLALRAGFLAMEHPDD